MPNKKTNQIKPPHRGFQKPTTTPTPDEVFDVWLAALTGAELKVLLYIVRRTFGFGKSADAISLRQICSGITTRDGRVLDQGTGLSRKAASQAVQSLEAKGLIRVERVLAEDGVNQVNVYSLVFSDEGAAPQEPSERSEETHGGVVTKSNYGSVKRRLGVVTKGYPQETVLQQTEQQQVVVDQLTQLGIEKETAQQLAARYAPDHIREKAELLQWLEAKKAGRRIVDPAAWLVRAIENDYRPPRGFKTQAQRRAEEEAQRRETAERLAQEETRQRAHREQQRQARARWLQALYARYGTTAAELELWPQVLAEIQLMTTRAAFATWIKPTQLLSLKDGKALIGVGSPLAKEMLAGRLEGPLRQAFANVGKQVDQVEFVVLDEAGDSPPSAPL